MTQTPPSKRTRIKLPPTHGDDFEIRHVGPSIPEGSGKVYVWSEALSELIHASLRRPTVMQSAILVGGVYAGPGLRFVEVRGFIDLERFDNTTELARSLNDSWVPLNNRVERQGGGWTILGWACLREREGALLERELQVLHRSFFNLPHQLLLSLDPVSEEITLYGFDETSRLVQIGFELVTPRHPERDVFYDYESDDF